MNLSDSCTHTDNVLIKNATPKKMSRKFLYSCFHRNIDMKSIEKTEGCKPNNTQSELIMTFFDNYVKTHLDTLKNTISVSNDQSNDGDQENDHTQTKVRTVDTATISTNSLIPNTISIIVTSTLVVFEMSKNITLLDKDIMFAMSPINNTLHEKTSWELLA